MVKNGADVYGAAGLLFALTQNDEIGKMYSHLRLEGGGKES
jgi:hypothetical protein